MTILTDVEQMLEDLKNRSEKLDVEFKAWMDISPTNKSAQGKIARHIAAIANYGGGRLYFGVDDDGNAQPASMEYDLNHYRSDVINNLLKTRLEPPLQCEVRRVELAGVEYPVVYIPSHGTTPVCAKDENGYLHVFVRNVGPESGRVEKFQQWDTLLRRCMRIRDVEAVQTREEDDLTRTQAMTKAITDSVTASILATLAAGGVPTGAVTREIDWSLIDMLAEETRKDFVSQIEALKLGTSETDQQIAEIAKNHAVMGYALLDENDSLITLERPQGLLRKVSDEMNDVASFGWHDFIVLPNSNGPPRTRFWKVGNKDLTGVEGMRVDQKQVYFGAFDYWRVFGNSIFVICKSYREDANRLRHKVNYPFLTSVQIFIRLHSLLAHATLIAPNVTGLKRVAFFIDHRGLEKRILGRDFDYGLRVHTHLAAEQDQYRYRIVVDVGELMNDYFSVLKRLSVPLLEIWAGANFEPDQWFTRDKIDNLVQYLQKEGSSVRLLDETAQTADA
ncbi:ATP-binding protein [Rhizobium leguminosarum bv. viciae]|uniref:AlbA family DNA-binding domain-containing protein n=1 Tax=Rhizobium TaxID=379 RepID=UPI001441554C|nr:ATP-binding protein [Rhizobium leguminosarum]NKK06146.1 ATP-binding protein [Rhizobium leguminosarum bv. viciae]